MDRNPEIDVHIRRVVNGTLVGITVLTLIASVPASLHLQLIKAEPAADAMVTTAPHEIRLFFSQEPEIRATRISITDAASKELTVGTAKADAKDGKIVFASITDRVSPGIYTVSWRTMAKDGHAVNGTFQFTFRILD